MKHVQADSPGTLPSNLRNQMPALQQTLEPARALPQESPDGLESLLLNFSSVGVQRPPAGKDQADTKVQDPRSGSKVTKVEGPRIGSALSRVNWPLPPNPANR